MAWLQSGSTGAPPRVRPSAPCLAHDARSRGGPMKRARIWVAVAATAVWATTVTGKELGTDSRPSWVATWAAAPQATGPSGAPARAFANETIRQIVHISVGGQYLRVRFSNAFGAGRLRI